LGANIVVELHSESHARKPTTRAWAIIRRADRNHQLAGQRARWLVFCGWFVGDWLSWQTPGALSPDLEDLL
jgi:hypothetical protein